MRSRLSRRALLVLLIAALAATAARLAAPTEAHPRELSRALFCGTERWYVKTLQDRPRLLRARRGTVATLSSLARPKPAPTDRIPLERRIYSVEAGRHACPPRGRPGPARHARGRAGAHGRRIAERALLHRQCDRLPEAANGRRSRQVRICAHARVVGAAFWDRPHNVTGRAPNSIELHPILDFACLS
jgi:hypothetical protein